MTLPGRRLLLESLRETAIEKPHSIAFNQILSRGHEKEQLLLTYPDLVKRIDEFSWWLRERIGEQNDGGTTVAYLAPNDLRTLLLPIAAAQCNIVVLLLSPRNGFEAQEHLIKSNNCSALIVDKVFDHVADRIENVQRIEAPDFWHLFAEGKADVEPYPSHITWSNSQSKTIVKLHTSGSTGLPKSVPFTHAVLATVDIQREIKDSEGHPCQLAIFAQARRPFAAFPFFHVAGFDLVCYMLFSGCEIILGPPHQPTSLESVRRVFEVSGPDALILPPSILDEIVLDHTLLERAARVKVIFYGGGQVSDHTGEVLSRKTRLFTGIGSTEAGSICLMPVESHNWKYFHFVVENGFTWDPVGTSSNEYEMVITRNSAYLPYQAVFHSFPDVGKWRTKDIFAKHPTVEGLWEYRGRLDDLIVLSTGEKLNPSVIEAVILSRPQYIKSALVTGNRRPRPALLIEPADHLQKNSLDQESLKNIIVETLNTDALGSVSRDGQISKDDIIISDMEKPFIRTAKGTVNRKLTEKLYETEIDAVYSNSKPVNGGHDWQLDLSSTEKLQSSLLQNFQALVSDKSLTVKDNLFYSGLDSRQAQIAALSIRKALQYLCPHDITASSFRADTIYSHPTVQSISEQILVNYSHTVNEKSLYDAALQTALKSYTDAALQIVRRASEPRVQDPKNQHVLLTGSTGFVGSYILRALQNRSDIKSITCLDRHNPKRTVDHNGILPKASVQNNSITLKLTGDLHQPNLGLPIDQYHKLLETVSCVVHCQWPVDFNHALAYFEPNIQGVSNLIKFCMETSNQQCPLIFLSSIATVQQFPNNPVPETHLSDPKHCETGYGESKLVASELLDYASRESGLNSVIYRVGQVCGPISGSVTGEKMPTWPSRDWFPTLLRSSRHMRCLPDTLGKASRIDWIPVDSLSEILVDDILGLTQAQNGQLDANPSSGSLYRHLVNTVSCNYEDVVEILVEWLSSNVQQPCKIVSLPEWVKQMEKHCLAEKARKEGGTTPGIELLQFFEGLSRTTTENSVILETDITSEALPRLVGIPVVDKVSLNRWLDALEI